MATEPNPYAAPSAQVDDVPDADNGDFIPGGRQVRAGRGWAWIAEGVRMFRQNPGVWIAIAVIFFLLSFVMQLIPFIGPLVFTLIAFVLVAGPMIGCNDVRNGDALTVGHLFRGFSANAGQLILLGVLYFVGVIIVVAIVALLFGGALQALGSVGLGGAMAMGPGVLLAILVGVLFIVPLVMAIWFSPALISLNGLSALEAMKQSFSASLKNILPFLVYGLIALGIGIVIMTVASAVLGGLIGGSAISGSGGTMVGAIVMSVLVYAVLLAALIPIGWGSMYASYRDVFHDE